MISGDPPDPALLIGAAAVGLCVGLPLSRWAARLLRTWRVLGFTVDAAAMAATALLFAALTARFGLTPELVAYIVLASAAVVLSIVDLAEKRLPNVVVMPSAAVLFVVFAAASAISGDWSALLGAVVGGASLFGVYFTLALIRPSAMGMGDVKLALVLGIALGYLGLHTWLMGLVGGVLIGGVVSLGALASRAATRSGSIPYGPSMLAGAILAILVTP